MARPPRGRDNAISRLEDREFGRGMLLDPGVDMFGEVSKVMEGLSSGMRMNMVSDSNWKLHIESEMVILHFSLYSYFDKMPPTKQLTNSHLFCDVLPVILQSRNNSSMYAYSTWYGSFFFV